MLDINNANYLTKNLALVSTSSSARAITPVCGLPDKTMKYPIAVTVPDAVRASGMSRSSLYEALKRGDLTAHKAGRRTLISYSDLQAYLANLPEYKAGA